MKRLALLLPLLVACSGPGRPLEYSEEGAAPIDTVPAIQKRLVRSLDSLKAYQDSVERANCKPPACYWDPGPPSPP